VDRNKWTTLITGEKSQRNACHGRNTHLVADENLVDFLEERLLKNRVTGDKEPSKISSRAKIASHGRKAYLVADKNLVNFLEEGFGRDC